MGTSPYILTIHRRLSSKIGVIQSSSCRLSSDQARFKRPGAGSDVLASMQPRVSSCFAASFIVILVFVERFVHQRLARLESRCEIDTHSDVLTCSMSEISAG
jgi:hypothetical protein